ncbi:MAG TPA: PHP domain-containing protein [Solirubrobacteraceae bacterium]|jgi:hypothetical protein|nr:PHP domain-containing protein [Solirubrobacteraceae bacterium]
MAPTFSIAHVSPYPWEAEDNEVNAHIARVSEELARRGHRVLVLAPSRSTERVRESRRALRAARGEPEELLPPSDAGSPRVLAVGEVLDVAGAARRRPAALPIDVARTVEEALATLELDFVHVHEPFAPSTSATALRHSRALNVGTFHSSSERLLSTLLARRFVESFFGRLDARTAGDAETVELMQHYFPGSYTLLPHDERHAERIESVYAELAARRHSQEGEPAIAERLAGRPLIDIDLHMHTDHSPDCATPVEVLLATAREQGLGAIAVTDHNEVSGALEARAQADSFGVKVIVGEEVKTASEGEVIGLFLERKIPRGLTLRETIAQIRDQGGVVYVPHPFDRMHSVPDYEHLVPVIGDVDAIEVFNPRVAIQAFNDEAARFAAKYRITAGAGSDSHVAQGLGSVRVRMRDFDGPQEFVQSLREAEIHTRPSSLLYVQALKFLQTRATPRAARQARKARRVRRLRRAGAGARRR